MKKSEKLAYLKENHFEAFSATRLKVFDELSANRQCRVAAAGLQQDCMRDTALSLIAK